MKKELNMKKIWKTRLIHTCISLSLKESFYKLNTRYLLTGIMLSGSLFSQFVYAQETSVLPISFVQSSSQPKITHIPGTTKLIIDFDNAGNFKGEPRINGNKLIESISTQRNGNKLRIALDTKQPVKYFIIKDNNDYLLNLTASNEYREESVTMQQSLIPTLVKTTTVEQVAIVTKPIEPINVPVQTIIPISNVVTSSVVPAQILERLPVNELEHINVKGQGKVAKLTLDLSNNSIIPNIVQSGNLLIIDLPGTKIPEEFQKNISILNLGTVVQNMDVATQKGSGRIVLSQSDKWEYSVYQMDKRISIEIKPIVQDTSKDVYKGKPLTLNFQNMDVRAILQVIADFTGLNIMSSDSVNGSMTIRLKDVPWDQALDLVLEANNLQKQKQGNVIWVATRQEITDKNKSQLELNNQVAELAPLRLEFFQLNHYKAKEMKDIIEGKTGGTEAASAGDKGNSFALLSKRGSVGLDIRNNKIFIQDTEAKLEEIAKIIKRLDVASKQVLIEAKLVVVDDKFQRDLGAKFGFGVGKRNGNTGYGLSNSVSDANNIANGISPSGLGFNSPVLGGGSIGFTILNAVTGNMLNLELSALEENNRGKVISNPRLLTADNKKAEIRQGTEIPYVTPGSANSPATVSFKDAVLSLGVTPQVSPNGRVSMDLEITKDTVGQLVSVQGGGQVPSIDTRKITTQVTVNDGQTVVLGGIYEVTSRDDLSKVPFLGDIPWVGNLFKNTSRSNEKVELLIFITPHVIADEDLDEINQNEQTTVNEINFKKK